ncbi:MAG: hypothetical protein AAGH65_03070 [Pseudomonadota bacterium]
MAQHGSQSTSSDHWLVRPNTIRLLCWISAVILAATVAAQFFIHVHSYFPIGEVFGFNAVYGFLTCVAMVVFAKVLGVALKRPVDYYQKQPGFSAEIEDVENADQAREANDG